MSTLEDKILGEKTENYCSSSEDEGEDEKFTAASSATEDIKIPNKWEGTATNTGPKGVLQDFQRYKQLEAEKNAEKEKERLDLIKKLSLTCKSTLDEEEEDKELLEDDGFLMEYMQQRMKEMLKNADSVPKFGSVVNITNTVQYVDEIDQEHKNVTIIVHIYQDIPPCEAMNGCLSCLSKEYPNIKFCKIKSDVAGLSAKFTATGIPALLIYKDGQVIGNFVRLTEEFGEDFFANDVESFLIQHGILTDKTFIPHIIKSTENDQSDSDLSLDD